MTFPSHRGSLGQRLSIRTAALGFGILLCSCVDPYPPSAVEQGSTQPRLAERPQESDTVRGAGEPAIVTLPISGQLQQRIAAGGEPLPSDLKISRVNFSGVPIAAALQAVLAGTNISLSFNGDFTDRQVTILNLSGPLDQVVTRVCDAARVFCNYRNGALEVTQTETFIIEMPPIPSDAQNSISDAIGNLAGDTAQVDVDGGNIIYTTDRAGQGRVQQYLTQIRRGRPLVVMQLYIWEVRLNDATQAGIRFDSTNLGRFGINSRGTDSIGSIGGTPSSAGGTDVTSAESVAAGAIAGGVSLGATFNGAIDAAALVSFLQSQGTVETVSNPQLTFVSGTKSEFSVGGKQNYVSGVGQLVGTTAVTGGNSNNTGIGTNTTQTDTIETGIRVSMQGAYENGVVFGELGIEDVTLLGFDRVSSGGTDIQLPRTQERKLATIIRLRPGDTLLLAGLRSTSDDRSVNGLPTGLFGMLPFNSNKTTENREMVVMLRPAIIRFSDTGGADKIEPTASKSPLGDRQAGLQNGEPSPETIGKAAAVQNAQGAPAAVLSAAADSPGPDAAPVAVMMPSSSTIDASGKVSASGLQRAFSDVAATPAAPANGPVRLQP